MSKTATMTMAAMAAAACLAVQAPGAEVTVGADVASAYVFRGVTFNDGAVFQPYAEIGGLPVGLIVWGNLDIEDYDDTLNGGQFSEIDLALSYDLPLGTDKFGASVGYTEYTYPGAEGDADREAALDLTLDVPLSPSLGFYYGVDGGIEKSLHVGFALKHKVEMGKDAALTLGAGVGHENPDEGENGFSYYTASAKLSYKMLTASVTHIGQIDDDVLPDAETIVEEDGTAEFSNGYDVELVAAIGISYTF